MKLAVPAAACRLEIADRLAEQFDVLRSLAVRTIDTHLNDSGRCLACRDRWPCALVTLADNTLSLVADGS